MQTRRDRYHAHRFVARRTAYALLHGEPDSPEAPLRRLGIAALAGVAVLGLLAAVFGIYGLLRPGDSQAWRQPGSLIVEKETGTRDVFVDGALHPVLNYASARLVLGTSDLRPVLVSGSGLAEVSRGSPVGIEGAPDSLPDGKGLVAAPWTVCTGSATDADGTTRPTSVLDIGTAVAGQSMSDADAVLVRSVDGQSYLVWRGHRLTLMDERVAAALGYQAHSPTIVADAWLSAVPAGPDLRFPDVGDRGAAGPPVGALATRVGQVLVVRSPGVPDTYYLVVDDGLSPLTALGAALIVGDPASRAAYPGQVPAVIEVSAADVAASTRSARSSIVAGYPTTTPSLVDGSGVALCARFGDPSRVESPANVSLAPAGVVPSTLGSVRGTGDVATADVIRVPIGHGVVARTEAVTYLITDLGIKYPLATDQLLPTLGLSGVTPTSIESTLLSLVPTGPALDPAKARLYQNVVGGH